MGEKLLATVTILAGWGVIFALVACLGFEDVPLAFKGVVAFLVWLAFTLGYAHGLAVSREPEYGPIWKDRKEIE